MRVMTAPSHFDCACRGGKPSLDDFGTYFKLDLKSVLNCVINRLCSKEL